MSTVDLSHWCNDSRELQGTRLEEPDQRHKRLVLVSTYIHPGTASTKTSWDFLEQIKDELGTLKCGDFSRINMVTKLKRKLWKKPWASSLSTQRQLRYQHDLGHLGTRIAPLTWHLIVSPRIAPWLSAGMLTPHGSDNQSMVFSLQKPAKKQNIKPHNPFRYERSGSDTVSKLRKRKATQSTKTPRGQG